MEKTRPGSSARVPFIIVTILLDSLGIGLLIPILPDVIRRFGSDPAFVNTTFGYFISAYALMQFVASPVLGSLADRFGRRPVLLISLLGAGIDYLLMAFSPNLWLLFAGRIIAGLTGASMTVASSYMADISTDADRSQNFGLIGAGWGLGFIAGPVIGGVLGNLNWQYPFFAAAALNLLNFAFGLAVLPESLPAEKRRQIQIRHLNPFRSLAHVLRPGPSLTLVLTFSLIHLAGQVHPSVWTLYTEHKFGWSPRDVGFSLAFVGASIAFVQGALTRVIVPRLGEERTVRHGLWIQAAGFALFAVATHGWMMYAVLAVSSIAWVAGPALHSLISSKTPAHEQGELQGSLMSLGSLTAIIGPLMYTHLFASFSASDSGDSFPGAPYLAAAALCLFARGLLQLKTGSP